MNANSLLVEQVVNAIRQVVGEGPVALHEPTFSGNEWVYVKDCLDSTFVSSVGAYVNRFEQELADYTGANHAVAVVNGTAALHVALRLAGVLPGDEVLVPALTFVATANAVTYCGATPHFVESEERTFGIDAVKLRDYLLTMTEQRNGNCVNRRSGNIVRALVPMHVFGHPSDLDGLLDVARDFRLALVEDAAESLGSFYHGRHTGTIGKMGVLSFNGNKTITTGGGGAILTNDNELARQAKHLTTTAKLPHPWRYDHDKVGYNYRMPNLNAALGCAQLEQLSVLLRAKRELFSRYNSAFSNINEVKIIQEPENCFSNYWLHTLVLDQTSKLMCETILEAANNAGLMIRPTWTPLNCLEPFTKCPQMEMNVVQSLAQRVICLPSSASLVT